MLSAKPAAVSALVIFPALTAATSYSLVKEYSGSTFFNDWSFYGNYDNLTNGDAIFVTRDVAASSNLAYVNSAGNAIIKVDNTTTVDYNYKRNTVRVASTDEYAVGSVWVADMLHVPYGCSVWPAWWSQASAWPSGGEIDTFEGVNMVTMNQVALHTSHGCTITGAVQTSTLVNSTDCSYDDNANEGCVVTVTSTNSYGAGFAAAGGGVYVTEFSEVGINVWFFTRSEVPPALSTNLSVDTSALGTPTVNYPPTDCDINTYFAAQHLIFDITLCGGTLTALLSHLDFAGSSSVYAETCGTGTCYTDNVIGNGSNYASAYFEIQYVKVFSNSSTSTSSGSGNSNRGDRGAAVGAGLGALLGLGIAALALALSV
ncbi:concanavalin A-like lectin/glucanase domain-containing protein [Vararia minispora EC-137]|uniref:Concanavalin A-like lectin/glucanase domain-containing protein n=1 Tax=Vararia minispora EC-137 TaxID=1314806 RepID=A0ACB8QV49_9AGAM|nr:concanavalin A-like lectin/glucanase domain-containing protein [Vararia minispora EC-137]